MATTYFGVIGDMNPIDHGGGVVFDAGEGSGPCMTYFQPWEGNVSVYTIFIGEDVGSELDWTDWAGLASWSGIEESEMKEHAVSPNVLARASVYESVGGYHGFANLDHEERTLTAEQAEEEFGALVDAAHAAR